MTEYKCRKCGNIFVDAPGENIHYGLFDADGVHLGDCGGIGEELGTWGTK